MPNKYSFLLLFTSFLIACGGGNSNDTRSSSSRDVFEIRMNSISAPNNANAGDTITVTGSITNTGNNPAGITIGYYLSTDNNITDEDTVITFDIIALLYPGKNATFSKEFTIPPNIASGSYTLGVLADHINALNESNESDNLRVSTLDISGSNCSDDLYEEDDSPQSATLIKLGESQIHNNCLDDIDWFEFNATVNTQYGLFVSDYTRANYKISLFDINNNEIKSALLQNTGDHAVKLFWTAPDNEIYRVRIKPTLGLFSTGGNSNYLFSLATADIDLVTTNFAVQKNYFVYVGGTVDLYQRINNNGYTESGSFTIKYYLSSDNIITTSDYLILTENSDSILSNATRIYSKIIADIPPGITPGDYYVGVMIDSENTVPEYNEINNSAEPVLVTIKSLLNCTPDSFEEDDLVTLATKLTLDVTQMHNHCEDNHDWMKFDAIANTSYYIYMPISNPLASSPFFQIYDTDGKTLLSDDNGKFRGSNLTWTPTKTASYFIHATTVSSRASDTSYSIQIKNNIP